jgi:ATP-dependent Lhr-like helicase
MVAWTRLAKAGAASASVPRYAGGRLALDGGLAAGVLDLLARTDDALGSGESGASRGDDGDGRGTDAPRALAALGPEAAALAPLLALQRGLSALPRPGRLLVEHHATRDGRLLCLFPFAGRTLHEGLAALVALRWSRLAPNTLTFAANEHGLLVCAAAEGTPAPDEATLRALLSPAGLEDDLRASLNLAELGRRQFREIARVAGLLPPSLPGRAPRSLRAVQASAALLYDVLRQHDPGHVLLEQAEREVLARQLALPGLRALLERLAAEPVVARAPASLTPLAFGLWADRLRETLSSEDWLARIARAAATLEKRHARR